ncbi:hypothetical protein [Pseudophaeobacter sp.]|uniref:Uncharacterized protein n=1 Tax=Pseudophaeobacter arcticus TaxID=385492 RepID=A0ABQ0ALE0_9RHOB
MADGPSVKLVGESVVITFPKEDAQGLRVALAPCPCRAPKSTATTNIRNRLSKAIGRLLSKPQ